jgi:hypothetical protein
MGVDTAAASQSQEATANGSVTGSRVPGSQVVLHIRGTAPDGWRGVRQLTVTLVLQDAELEEIVFEAHAETIRIGRGPAVEVGAPAVAEGRFFELAGSNVEVTAGGEALEVAMVARVLEEIPPEATFRFAVVRGSPPEAASSPPDAGGGLTWGTLVLAIAAALFAGGFIGNLFASRRGALPARSSIYDALKRRLDEERAPT